ncbi:MAG: isocitrate/isopropylmalate dehydrogenase family protein [Acidobacteria bacterium]|nr:isocitrate/isopropylmalate dehydrogenase family protein [Acidobacteriota bacterium]
MARKVTLIAGDGVGPEVTGAAVRVINAAGGEIEWEPAVAGSGAIEKHGSPLPESTLESIQRNGVGLKGPVTTAVGTGFPSVNVALRKKLDLYANLRPVKNLPGVETHFDDVDLIVVRENTEDLYSGVEHVVAPGVTESVKIITKAASSRIARFAFEYAVRRQRKKVTAVHKANIMKISDGLFLEACRHVAQEFSTVQYQEIIVDNLAMQLVLNPKQFDILVLTNLYGDIISDLCAGLVGGLGLVPGANFGDNCAVFEAVHGSAPDIAGKNIANPLAVIFSGLLMLRYLGLDSVADRIRAAVRRVALCRENLTPDVGGSSTTTQLTESIIQALN